MTLVRRMPTARKHGEKPVARIKFPKARVGFEGWVTVLVVDS